MSSVKPPNEGLPRPFADIVTVDWEFPDFRKCLSAKDASHSDCDMLHQVLDHGKALDVSKYHQLASRPFPDERVTIGAVIREPNAALSLVSAGTTVRGRQRLFGSPARTAHILPEAELNAKMGRTETRWAATGRTLRLGQGWLKISLRAENVGGRIVSTAPALGIKSVGEESQIPDRPERMRV